MQSYIYTKINSNPNKEEKILYARNVLVYSSDIYLLLQWVFKAQRVMSMSVLGGQRSPAVDFGGLHLNAAPLPIPGLNPGREAQYTKRIKELEDEVRILRGENEKLVC